MLRGMRAAAVACALASGAVVAAIAGLTVVSIVGRWLWTAPLPGDVELVQLGTALAIALALPYCQLHASHLIVELATARAPVALQRALDTLAHGAAAAVLALLAWRAAAGVADLQRAGEVSMVLGVPLAAAYAAMVPALALAALIALALATERGRRALAA
jgi:TRAP-type C4-dicarboxylate transport system permease small subunit